MQEILNNYREQNNHRMKIYYYMMNDINKKIKNNEIKIELLVKNNDEMNKKIINLSYSLIISYLIIIYLIFIK